MGWAPSGGWRHWLGLDALYVPPEVRWQTALGGVVGLGLVYATAYLVLGPDAYLVVPSMGAGAVLLFGAPHAPMSQPWPALAGHFVSALIGVGVYRLFGAHGWAAALAVGAAIGAMHQLRCLHPPGGATAYVAVMGGASVHALGFGFVLAPAMLNAAELWFVAWVFHNFVRRNPYPPRHPHPAACPIRREHLMRAIEEEHELVDVHMDVLVRVVERAWRHAERAKRMHRRA